jgi:peptidoglycan/LPS O-acetylase OafA/YrhL
MRIPDAFRRVTSSGNFLPEIDGLRAIAICWVVLFHTTLMLAIGAADGNLSAISRDAHETVLGYVVSHGFLGVQLFFMVSGFVVLLPFARRWLLHAPKPLLSRYYARRVLRIEPPYIIALATYFVAATVAAREAPQLRDYLSGAVYARTWLGSGGGWPFFVSWSLEIEVQFYLLAPLFAQAFRIPSRAIRRAVMVAMIAASAWYAARVRLAGCEPSPLDGPLQHGNWLGPELCFFLLGALMADLWVDSEERSSCRRKSPFYDCIFVMGAVSTAASYRALEVSAWGILFLLVGLFAMGVGALRSTVIRRALAWAPVATVGGACYTIYLFHTLVINALGRKFAPSMRGDWLHDVPMVALPAAAGVIVLGILAFPLVERPFMISDWPARVWALLSRSNRIPQPDR